jgi:hypothetical protein
LAWIVATTEAMDLAIERIEHPLGTALRNFRLGRD